MDNEESAVAEPQQKRQDEPGVLQELAQRLQDLGIRIAAKQADIDQDRKEAAAIFDQLQAEMRRLGILKMVEGVKPVVHRTPAAPAPAPVKRKAHISPEGIARIRAGTKKRWAAYRDKKAAEEAPQVEEAATASAGGTNEV